MSTTNIEWAHRRDKKGNVIEKGVTWNPLTGCDKVLFCGTCHNQLIKGRKHCTNCLTKIKDVKPVIDPACVNCYMFPQAKRNKLMQIGRIEKDFAEKKIPLEIYREKLVSHSYRHGTRLTIQSQLLAKPLSWTKPRTVFVNSMSDVFHEDVSDEFILEMFKVMNQAKKHTFQVLTKRSWRLLELSKQIDWTPNIWMGVSIGSSKELFRLVDLLQINAIIKFVSVEPLVEQIDFSPHLTEYCLNGYNPEQLWIITGGESPQPKSREMNLDWARQIRNDCKHWFIPFFFKQIGGTNQKCTSKKPLTEGCYGCGAKGCRQLDGQFYNEYPQIG